MSLPTREELLKRFGDVTDPEVLARRKRIADVLVEKSPETKQRILDEGRREGQLTEARATLRRLLARRQLSPSTDEDARIEVCTDLSTLWCWQDQAVTAASVADALA